MKDHAIAILRELKSHAPFTAIGALTGVACMLVFRTAEHETVHGLFQVFHPAHVVLSALATASLFKLRRGRGHVVAVLLVGYLGSIGVATLSDCIVPFLGETVLGVVVPIHGHLHEVESGEGHEGDHEAEHAVEADDGGHHGPELHLPFIEEWYIVNPAALLGVLIAYILPQTRLSHTGHVLVSTWASSFYMLIYTQAEMTPVVFVGAFIVLFVAVWLPCCISDIVFPMLFVSPTEAICCSHGCKH
jgi:hypothetical protein